MKFYEGSSRSTVVIGIGTAPRYDCGVFARGYRAAARTLTTHLLSEPRFADYEAYPVVFLYRHAFELQLKNIIYQSARIGAFNRLDDVDNALYNLHDLRKLSQTATAALLSMFPDDAGLRALASKIGTVAADFSEIDPDSYSYRYPVDRRGGPATAAHQSINLDAFYRQMEELLTDLEVVEFGLDVESDRAQEVYELLEDLLRTWR